MCAADSYSYFEYDDFFNNPVTIFKCINCGHGFHEIQYSQKQFDDMYQEEYAARYIDKTNALCEQRQEQYKLDVECLLGSADFKDIDVLDFGCSSGDYLENMPGNWNKHGYEVNPVELKHLRATKPAFTIYDDLKAVDKKFDLITMRGVVEHIQDHSELLDFLSSHLRKGSGMFFSATPDFSSVCATLYKQEWNQLRSPEHIHQFTPTSLAYLLGKIGLVMRSFSHAYDGTPYANWGSDKSKFLENFKTVHKNENGPLRPIHAFPGNMFSAYFEMV